ncbi:MAG TPA: helix-turn-helix domain-containing protein [Mycobacterium sp.]|nr:helix-turn-helix domain-containing protein [Mycobacterium sp.]
MTTAGGRRRDVLAALRDADAPLGVAAIAERLGVHSNTVRFHLDSLVAAGQVQRVLAPPAKPGRPPQLYVASPGMDPGGPRHYRLLAEALVDSVARGRDPQGRATAGGRAMGARLGASRQSAARREPVEQLLDLLDELGFAPQPQTDAALIDLRHCPFLELAQAWPEVVCPVHLGLMQGAMEGWDAPVSVDGLRPFVESDRCVARLSGQLSG